MNAPLKLTQHVEAGKTRGRQRTLRFLSQPLQLEEAGPPRLLRQLLLTLSVLVCGFLVLAGVTEVQETAVGDGQVMPAGSVHVVQHLEGGIVSDLRVAEGQLVDADEVLVLLERAAAEGELEQLRARQAALAVRAERLRAFVLDSNPDFAAGETFPALVRDQEAILEMQRRTRESQREVLLSRVDQRQAEIDALVEQRTSLETQVEIVEEEVAMRTELLEKGLVSRVIYLETKRNLSRARGDLAAVIGEQARAREARAEAQSSLAELEARLRNEALDEMGTVSAELAQVTELLAKLEDRVIRLDIKAPVRGRVKGLTTRTLGSVIAPGEVLMEIVPIDDVMVAEVRLSPRDVGHIRADQKAEISVSTYDTVRYGTISGTVTQVSASTFQDENGEPYYKATISLDKNHVGERPDRNLILPGMVVDARINTGGKTLLEYLLKPVYRSLDNAFDER